MQPDTPAARRGLPQAEACLEAAIAARKIEDLEVAIRFAVRSMAAADPALTDVTEVISFVAQQLQQCTAMLVSGAVSCCSGGTWLIQRVFRRQTRFLHAEGKPQCGSRRQLFWIEPPHLLRLSHLRRHFGTKAGFGQDFLARRQLAGYFDNASPPIGDWSTILSRCSDAKPKLPCLLAETTFHLHEVQLLQSCWASLLSS